MGTYRKKPATVEAMRVSEIIELGIEKGPGGMPEWLVQALSVKLANCEVKTKQGQWVSVGPDEWIVCAAPDDLWPVHPDVFEETYEPA